MCSKHKHAYALLNTLAFCIGTYVCSEHMYIQLQNTQEFNSAGVCSDLEQVCSGLEHTGRVQGVLKMDSCVPI